MEVSAAIVLFSFKIALWLLIQHKVTIDREIPENEEMRSK